MSRIRSRHPSSRFAVLNPRHHRRPSRAALRTLEALEPRTLLSTLYVNSSNTNSSPNGSQANPYKTIQAAINASASATTILVETGKGYNESDTVGANLSNLSIKAGTSQVPILDGGAG